MATYIDALKRKLDSLPEGERRAWVDHWARELDESAGVYALSDAERALIREGVADLDAGRVLSKAEMDKFWARNR